MASAAAAVSPVSGRVEVWRSDKRMFRYDATTRTDKRKHAQMPL